MIAQGEKARRDYRSTYSWVAPATSGRLPRARYGRAHGVDRSGPCFRGLDRQGLSPTGWPPIGGGRVTWPKHTCGAQVTPSPETSFGTCLVSGRRVTWPHEASEGFPSTARRRSQEPKQGPVPSHRPARIDETQSVAAPANRGTAGQDDRREDNRRPHAGPACRRRAGDDRQRRCARRAAPRLGISSSPLMRRSVPGCTGEPWTGRNGFPLVATSLGRACPPPCQTGGHIANRARAWRCPFS